MTPWPQELQKSLAWIRLLLLYIILLLFIIHLPSQDQPLHVIMNHLILLTETAATVLAATGKSLMVESIVRNGEGFLQLTCVVKCSVFSDHATV